MTEAAARRARDGGAGAAAEAAWLDLSLAALRLRLERRVLWLRAAPWTDDRLHGYGEQVVSDTRADWLLRGVGGAAYAGFLERDADACALARRIAAAEADAEALRRRLVRDGRPAPIDRVAGLFGLSPLEQTILLTALAPKLDAGLGQLYGYVHDRISVAHATPHLIEALLAPDVAALDVRRALLPTMPLRRFRLVECPGDGGPLSPILLDERMADALCGLDYLDPRARDVLQPASPAVPAPCHLPLVAPLVAVLAEAARPAVNLIGPPRSGRRGVAAAVADRAVMGLLELRLDRLPAEPAARLAVLALIEREAALLRFAVLLDADAAGEPGPGAGPTALADAVERLEAFLIVVGERAVASDREIRRLELTPPDAASRRAIWAGALAESGGADADVAALAAHFDFASTDILRVAQDAAAAGAETIWRIARRQSGADLGDLAQRIEPRNGWDDLVLPDAVAARLKSVAAQVAQRGRVYEEWGFARRMSRGQGISVLFAGPSGVGKTLAAEVIAGSLNLDLYRIDLAGVVSKYIGETEKNLRRIFDAAERSGAILLFDEADALFGKRSDVKDSHDRYANIEVSYLLQRMEEYRGLAILATNMKTHLDQAFLRRLRFVVNFPMPDSVLRRRIWAMSFPPDAPAEGIDLDLLARLEVAGGNIRNIALNAAFLAAEHGRPLGMRDIAEAARAEFEKIDRQMPLAEFAGERRA